MHRSARAAHRVSSFSRSKMLLLTVWVGALAVACGGKAVLDGESTEGSGGTSTDPLAGVACGSAGVCTFECCVDLALPDAMPFCATNCPVGIAASSCDGPEDCGGESCCGNLTDFACAPTCDDLERCHTDADCENGTCSLSSVGSVDFSICMR